MSGLGDFDPTSIGDWVGLAAPTVVSGIASYVTGGDARDYNESVQQYNENSAAATAQNIAHTQIAFDQQMGQYQDVPVLNPDGTPKVDAEGKPVTERKFINGPVMDANIANAELAAGTARSVQDSGYIDAALGYEMGNMSRDTQIKDALAEEQLNELKLSRPVTEEFYKKALRGVDPNERMQMAEADVQQSWEGAMQTGARDMMRYGMGVGSGRAVNTLIDSQLRGRAEQVGGARTKAYRDAENDSFTMLAAGKQTAGTATGLSNNMSNPSAFGVGGDASNLQAQQVAAGAPAKPQQTGYNAAANYAMGYGTQRAIDKTIG